MASPKTAVTRYDLSLRFGEFLAALNRRKFIGHLVFPPLPVALQTANFLQLPAEAVMPPTEDTKRNPDGTYPRSDWQWETTSYVTVEHGVEEITDDRKIKMYGGIVPAEEINRDRVVQRIANAYEVACAASAFDTAYFTGAYTGAVTDGSSGFTGYAWTDTTHADPIKDVDNARAAFITNAGVSPNALVLEETALLAMMRTSRIEDVVKYTGQVDSLTARNLVPQIADVLRLQKIIIADAPMKNTAGHGAGVTFSRIWGTDKALLCRLYDGPDLEFPEPHMGRTIMWSEEAGPLPGSEGESIGCLVEEYREENRRGGVIRGRTDYQVKRLYKNAGYLMTALT